MRTIALLLVVGLTASIAGITPRTSFAQLNAAAGENYDLSVSFAFDDNPLFTEVYVEMVAHEVRDRLRRLFGPLAEIRVAEPNDPLRLAILRVPLEQLTCPVELGSEKRFHVALHFDQGVYRIEWRQLDGDTKQIGPLRQVTTVDRQWVAKSICLAIRDEFNPTATVTKIDGKTLTLAFRASAWPQELETYLSEPTLLRLIRVKSGKNGGFLREPLDRPVLLLSDRHPTWVAQCLTPLDDPLKTSEKVDHFEAIKLNTTSGRVRVRVTNEKTRQPVTKCLVYVSDNDSGKDLEADRLDSPDAAGVTTSSRFFNHVAFVRVAIGGSGKPIAVPITDKLCDVPFRVRVDVLAGEKSDLERRLGYLRQDVQVLTQLREIGVKAFNEFWNAKKYDDCLTEVDGTLALIEPLVRKAKKTHADLMTAAEKLQATMVIASLQSMEKSQFNEIDAIMKQLNEKRGAVFNMVQRNQARDRAAALRAAGMEAIFQGDIEHGMQSFRDALKETPDDAGLAKDLASYEEKWKIKSPEHQRARDFVFKDLDATDDPRQIGSKIEPAKQALATLRQAADRLTARKLQIVVNRLMAALDEITENIKSKDPDQAQVFGEQIEKLLALVEEITAFIASEGAPVADTSPPEPDAKKNADK